MNELPKKISRLNVTNTDVKDDNDLVNELVTKFNHLLNYLEKETIKE